MRRINSPLVTAAAAVIGALALSTGAAAHDRDAPGGMLVFATGGDGRSDKLEIAAVNPEGRGFRELTHLPASGDGSRWSGDGRRILFVTEDSFTDGTANWSMRPNGTAQRRLPGFAWDVPSPSGRLVFGYDRIVDAKGKLVRRLRPGLRRDEYYTDLPLWAPNGSYVVINAARERANSDFYDYAWVDLVPTAPGGRGRPLTPRRNGRFAEALSWSPNSRRMLIEDNTGRTSDWYTVAPDGGDRRLLLRTPRGLPGGHAWSPDSRRIAYVGARGGIFLIDANGGQPRRLATTRGRTRRDAEDVELDWSTRAEIAFTDKDGTYVMRADGAGVHRLSKRTGVHEWSPALSDKSGELKWSPDGRRLVLSEGRSIYVIDRRGRERQLTHWLSDDDPQLSPDGRRVAFVRGRGVEVKSSSVYVMNVDGTGTRRLGPACGRAGRPMAAASPTSKNALASRTT
jgi:Tol biopolymer transport system component